MNKVGSTIYNFNNTISFNSTIVCGINLENEATFRDFELVLPLR